MLPYAQVTLQRAPTAGGDWSDLTTAQADDTGAVTFDVTAIRAASYRIVAATDPDRWAGQPGPETLIRSRAAITVRTRPTSVRLN